MLDGLFEMKHEHQAVRFLYGQKITSAPITSRAKPNINQHSASNFTKPSRLKPYRGGNRQGHAGQENHPTSAGF